MNGGRYNPILRIGVGGGFLFLVYLFLREISKHECERMKFGKGESHLTEAMGGRVER